MPREADPPIRYSGLISKLQGLLRQVRRDPRITEEDRNEISGAVSTLTRVLGDVQARQIPES